MTEHIAFLLCGQTDSGKSTICGHLLCLVHYFEQRVIDQTRASTAKNKFSLLLDTDDIELELASKDKTKTAAFVNFDFKYNDKMFRIIDTPGHKIYIRSMIEGLFHSKLRAACIVVSAVEDEFYSGIRGTTLEDLLLARASGCKNLVVLWNKTDSAKPTNSMRELIQYEAKMMSFKNIAELNVSGYSGENLLSLLEIIENMPEDKAIETKELSASDKIHCQVIFKTSQLITAGFLAIMHYGHNNEGKEIDIEIEKIKGARMIKDTKPYDIIIKLPQSTSFHTKQRIIFRTGSETIGFGVIINVVNNTANSSN